MAPALPRALILAIVVARLGSVLGTATAAATACTDPSTIVEGQTLDEFMTIRFKPLLTRSLDTVTAESPDFQRYLRTTKECQMGCFHANLDTAIATMWQDGQMFDTSIKYDHATEAITGAFKSCYPRYPREYVVGLMGKVIDLMKPPPSTTQAPNPWLTAPRRLDANATEAAPTRALQSTQQCVETTTVGAGKDFVNHFMTNFPQAFGTVMQGDSGAKTFFTTQAKQCQNACLQSVLNVAVANLYETGLYKDKPEFQDYATDIITGGLKACYPSVPHSKFLSMTTAVLPLLTSTSEASGTTCVPNTTVQEGKTMAQFLKAFDGIVKSELSAVMSKNAAFDDFLRSTMACQQTCLFATWDQAVGTLWRTTAMFSEHKEAALREVLTGGFKACYPRMPREEVLSSIQQIVNGVAPYMNGGSSSGRRLNGVLATLRGAAHAVMAEVSLDPAHRRLQSLQPCKGGSTTGDGKAFVDGFMAAYPQYLQQEIDKDANAKDYFSTHCKDCQSTCAATTMRLALSTLWDTGMIFDTSYGKIPWGQDVITGAMKACYPEPPRDVLHSMVGAMLQGCANWPQGSPEDNACVAATTPQGLPGYQKYDLSNFMAMFKPTLSSALAAAENEDANFKGFMATTKTCQQDCVFGVYDIALQTMWGTSALFGDNHEKMLQTVLTGGFKACYPRAPRAYVLDLMQEVVKKTKGLEGQPVAGARRLNLVPTQQCAATTQQGQTFVSSFMNNFPGAFKHILLSSTAAHSYFTQDVKNCQNSCAPVVLKKSLETFYNSGLISDASTRGERLTDVVTGALMACYPDMDHTTLRSMVADILRSAGLTRLYVDRPLELEVSGRSWTFVTMGIGISLTAVAASLSAAVLYRRLRRSGFVGVAPVAVEVSGEDGVAFASSLE